MLDRYRRVRALTESLAHPLSPEDQTAQSMPDASPTKWHRAHTTWFFETFLLAPHLADYAPFDRTYGYLFNSYYESVGPRHARPRRGLLSRPSVEDVTRYRAHVDQGITRLIEGADANVWATIEPLLLLGLNHEQQHQELLLTDIRHMLSCNPLMPAYRDDLPAPVPRPAPSLDWIEVESGVVEIGHPGGGFAFDNETPRHKAYVAPFRLATRPATNREYLDFVEDGGYARPEHWLADGWAAVQTEGWQAPLYWRHRDGCWLEFTLGGLRPLDLDAPVNSLSFYEADAFAKWHGRRLPTEAEWEIAAATADPDGNLMDRGYLHPAPANGDDHLKQMYGDVWEWTASAYTPYPGFRPADGAIGEYNGKFMVNQIVLRGGSCATPADHIRATYRNFFYPNARWQFSGVRLADDP
jgi:ergothioneine biosynthesis protein EgtB